MELGGLFAQLASIFHAVGGTDVKLTVFVSKLSVIVTDCEYSIGIANSIPNTKKMHFLIIN
jgi:hypothetical protein